MHGGKSIAGAFPGILGFGYPHMHGGKSVTNGVAMTAPNSYPHMHGGKSISCKRITEAMKVIPICMGVNLSLNSSQQST